MLRKFRIWLLDWALKQSWYQGQYRHAQIRTNHAGAEIYEGTVLILPEDGQSVYDCITSAQLEGYVSIEVDKAKNQALVTFVKAPQEVTANG